VLILQEKNEKLKSIHKNIKKTFNTSSLLELSDVLNDSQNSRAFIFIMDKITTHNEIVIDLLDDLIIDIYEFNEILIQNLHNSHEPEKKGFNLDSIFNFKNLKYLIIIAILIGVTMGVAGSETLITKILTTLGFLK